MLKFIFALDRRLHINRIYMVAIGKKYIDNLLGTQLAFNNDELIFKELINLFNIRKHNTFEMEIAFAEF